MKFFKKLGQKLGKFLENPIISGFYTAFAIIVVFFGFYWVNIRPLSDKELLFFTLIFQVEIRWFISFFFNVLKVWDSGFECLIFKCIHYTYNYDYGVVYKQIYIFDWSIIWYQNDFYKGIYICIREYCFNWFWKK